MAKSIIYKKVMAKEISIKDAIDYLIAISNEINLDQEIVKWAKSEFLSYKDKNSIPEYRKIGRTRIIYSGINGNFKVTKIELPFNLIEDTKINQYLDNLAITNSIGDIEFFANQDKEIGLSLINELGPYLYSLYNIQCVEIYMSYPASTCRSILDNTRLRLLDIYSNLDKTYGNKLDSLDFSDEFKENSPDIIINGNKNTIKGSNFGNNTITKSSSLNVNIDPNFKFDVWSKIKRFFKK